MSNLKKGIISKKPGKENRRIHWGQISSQIYTTIICILAFIPLYIMVINAFKTPDYYVENGMLALPTPEGLTFKYFPYAWNYYVKGYIMNTVIIAVASIVLKLLLVSLAAYAFTQFRFFGKEVLFYMFLILMMIPGILTIVPQYQLVVDVGLDNKLLGVILPSVTGSIPYGIFLLRSFVSSIPRDLFEAAEIDGASHFRRYVTISIPLCKSILFTLGLSTLLSAWNELVWQRLVLKESYLYTISIGIYDISKDPTFGTPLKFATYCLVSVPLIFAFFFTSKQFVSGLTSGAVKM